jgi:hypothetical protein
MPQTPAPRKPGQNGDPSGVPAGSGGRPWLGSPDWELAPNSPDWDPEYLAVPATDDGYPGDLEEDEDPGNAPPAGLDDGELAALLAGDRARTEAGSARAGQAGVRAALGAVTTGRRRPGMPGSEEVLPGQDGSPAAGFASGQPLDTAPGCAVLGSFLDDAAGTDDRYAGASDDELIGVICAQDRAEANASARKHAAVAELIRRRPAPGAEVQGPAQMPEAWHEFTGRELGAVLGVAFKDAQEMLGLAWYLEVNLPGTKAAFRAGIVSRDKAAVMSTTRSWPGWNAGPSCLATRAWPAGSCRPPRSWPPTSASPPGPKSSAKPGWTAAWPGRGWGMSRPTRCGGCA